MLADQLDFVVGVDSHRDSHAVAVVAVASGVVVFEADVAADGGGYAEALRLAARHAPGRRAFAIEGTGSYGAGLSRFLLARDERVFEVGRPASRAPLGRQDRRARRDPGRAQRAHAEACGDCRGAQGNGRRCRALMAAREGAANAKQAGLSQLYATCW